MGVVMFDPLLDVTTITNTSVINSVPDSRVLNAKVTYNRNGALTYARKYWNLVCHDLFIAGKWPKHDYPNYPNPNFIRVPKGTHFDHVPSTDPSQYSDTEKAISPDGRLMSDWGPLDDCTHFVSCCIGQSKGEESGGLPIRVVFPTGPYGIVGAKMMVDFLTTSGWVRILGEKSSENTLPKELQPGDLIAYHDGQTYVHCVLYLGDNYICCHTYSRSDNTSCTWDNTWRLTPRVADWTKTFLHFVV